MRLVFSDTAPIIKGRIDDEHVKFAVIERPASPEDVVVAKTHEDLTYDEITSDQTDNEAEIVSTNVPLGIDVTVTSSSPAVATIEDNRFLRYVSDGDTFITVDNGAGFGGRGFKRTMLRQSSVRVDITGFGAGTAAKAIYDEVSALISGLSAGAGTQRYFATNNSNLDAPAATLNPNCFASAYDWSGVSAMSTGRTQDTFPITLVTSRHALTAKHVAPAIGTRFAFRRPDGSFQVATVADVDAVVASGLTPKPDISVVLLDQDITGCAIYSVPETSAVATQFPALVNSLAGYGLTGHAVPLLRRARHFPEGSTGSAVQINTLAESRCAARCLSNIRGDLSAAITAGLLPWGADKAIGGDSGGPSFIPWGGALVLLGCQYTQTTANNVGEYVDEINALMDAQAGAAPGTWALGVASLS